MAAHSSDIVNWWLEIDLAHLDYLRPVRHWAHLSMASGPGVVWVKDLRPGDVASREIKSIPFKRLLQQRDRYLFPADGHVPVMSLPEGLQWVSLEKGLPLHLPSFNHNYFGVQERLAIRLIPSFGEQDPAALLLPLSQLQAYAETAPAVRLLSHHWVLIQGQALVLGTPMLPLPGEAYWQFGAHLLPAGSNFEYPILAGALATRIGQGGLLLWDREGACVPIPPDHFRPLSRSSVRLTGSGAGEHFPTTPVP